MNTSFSTGRLRWAAYASTGAGVVHGTAMGMHAEHATLADTLARRIKHMAGAKKTLNL